MATGVWLESHFNATAAASFNTKALQSQPKARLQFPEWCDAPLDGFAGEWLASYACESYLASPIQGTIFIADVVAVWFIIAIMYRWFQQEQTRRKTRAKIALAVRGRRNWAVLAAVIRLASCAAESRGPSKLGKLSGNLGPLPNGQAKWSECWRRVISLRADRKSDLVKIDFHLFGVMMRSSGRMLVLAMTLLILFEIRSFFQVVVPGIVGPWPVRYLVKCIGLVLSVRIFFDYARTSLTDPGQPAHVSTSKTYDANLVDEEICEQPKWCGKCQARKPERCHHCKVCQRCVAVMDHHCPFINNCVGIANRKFFCLFLLDLVIGCLMLVLLLLPHVRDALRNVGDPTRAHQVHVTAAFMVALIAELLLGPFCFFHWQLVLMNRTTLEHMKMRSRRLAYQKGLTRDRVSEEGYSRGLMENFAFIFGEPPSWGRCYLQRILEMIAPEWVTKRKA